MLPPTTNDVNVFLAHAKLAPREERRGSDERGGTVPFPSSPLRACFVESRVGVVVYALVNERGLCYRPLRRGMDLSEKLSSGLKVTGQNACPRLAGDLRRHPLCFEERLSLATAAR